MSKRSSNTRNSIMTALQEINLIDSEDRNRVYNELTNHGSGSVGRHDFKKLTGGVAGNYIFSISTMKQTLQMSQRMGLYIRENYGINRLERIEEHHIVSFLDHQKQKGNSPKTLKDYKNAILKLSKGCEKKWGYSIYTEGVKDYDIGGRIDIARERVWTNEQVKEIVENVTGKYKTDIEIMYRAGIRIHELYQLKGQNITLESNEVVSTSKENNISKANTIFIIGKGGKRSYIPIQPESIEFFRQLKEAAGDNGRISKSPKDRKKARNAIGSAIRRTSKKLFGRGYTRNHEFRKSFADQLWTRMREEGYSKKERIAYVLGRCLGHGHSRGNLIDNYINNGNKH